MLQINEYFYRLQGRDDFVRKKHFHNEVEFIHVVEGNGTLLKNNKTYRFQPGMVFLIDARNAHIVFPEENNCENYVRNKIVIDADSFTAFCDDLGLNDVIDDLFSAPPVAVGENAGIDNIFKKVHLLCETKERINIGFSHKYIIELIEWLYSQPVLQMEETGTTIQSILNYVAQKGSTVSLNEISNALHLDKYYICHLFKEKTGITFSEYVRSGVLKKSEELLVYTDYPVEKIAMLCGFSTASTFSRFFKNKRGVSPLVFRKENGRKEILK